jgi:hypothetical protein
VFACFCVCFNMSVALTLVVALRLCWH